MPWQVVTFCSGDLDEILISSAADEEPAVLLKLEHSHTFEGSFLKVFLW